MNGVIGMSYSMNNVHGINRLNTFESFKDRPEKDSVQESEKKQQIVCEREGSYYCTYMVDDKGQKILIKKIPAPDTDNKKNPQKQNEIAQPNPSNYSIDMSARTAFKCKQEMKTQVVHKENLQQIMSILKEYSGIPGDTGKTYDY